MNVGDAVVVHSAFEDTWVSGFEIAAVVDGGFVLKRLSDGRRLPGITGPDDVRAAPDHPWYLSRQ